MGIEGNQQIIKSEQGRLDQLDTKVDKKVAINGKDYADILFKKVDATIDKVNSDFGIKNEAILKDKNYQNMKVKAINGITETLFRMDEKNIAILSEKLDKALSAIEEGGKKMKTLEASLSSSDKLAQQLLSFKGKGDIDGMIKTTKEYLSANEQTLDDAQKVDLLNQLSSQLFEKAEQLKKGEVMKVKGVEWRLGDNIVASRMNMGANSISHDVLQIAQIEKIDTQQGVTLREGKTTRIIPLADFEKYLDDSINIQNQYGKEKNLFVLANNRRIVATENLSDLIVKEAQETQQKAALIALKDLIVKGSSLASCKDFKAKSPRSFALIKDGSVTINAVDGTVSFNKSFEKNDLKDQQIVVDELIQFLKEKGAEQKVEDAKSPEEKTFYQAELDLQQGNIAHAHENFIKFIQSPNGKNTAELEPLKQKAEGYLKGMWLHSMNEFNQANDNMFGKEAVEQVRDKMKYGLLKGDTQQMKRFEDAFNMIHFQVNERINTASQDNRPESYLQDPSAIFKDLPQTSGENSTEIKACQNAWQKIAYAQTMEIRSDAPAQKQGHYADAAEALRSLGLYNFSEEFIKKGLRERLDLTKNSETLQSKKQECIMRLNTHRDEYATRVKQEFLEQTRNQPGRPELSEEKFNSLIDQAIERTADQQVDNLILKATVSQMDEGNLKGPDAQLAQIYKNIENPNEDILSFSDKEISALGDKVIKFATTMAVQAALMALTGGVGNIASAGMRAALMSTGAREALAEAGAFMVNSAAFEVANKTISPYVTGGPGFTNMEDFARDYGKSLLMFGALHGVNSLAGAAIKEAGGAEAMTLGQKATHYAAQLGTEVSVLAGLSELEAASTGKLSSVNGVHLLGENVASALGLRAGGKIVKASGINESLEQAAKQVAKAGESIPTIAANLKKVGTNFMEGFNKTMQQEINMQAEGQVAYSGVSMAPLAAGLKNAFRNPAPTEIPIAKTEIPVAETEIPAVTSKADATSALKDISVTKQPAKGFEATIPGGGKKALDVHANIPIPGDLGKNPAAEINRVTQPESIEENIALSSALQASRDIVDSYAKSPTRTESMKNDISNALELLEKGETPNTNLGKEIAKLKQNDPAGYNYLKNSDINKLIRTSCFEAILYGKRESMNGINGKAITIYKGNDIAKGGMGFVAEVAYAVEGQAELQFGAIKRPHPNMKIDFGLEVKGASTIAEWNHPQIIKPIYIGNNEIIYETTEQKHDLVEDYENAKPADYFDILLDVGKGLQEYRNRNLFHGDIKERNVMRLQTGVDSQGQATFETKIIDNTPMDYHMSLESRALTPRYSFTEKELLEAAPKIYFSSRYAKKPTSSELYRDENGQELKGQDSYDAIDNLAAQIPNDKAVRDHLGRGTDIRAYGQMIEDAIAKKIPEIKDDPVVKEFIAQLKDPVRSGQADMLERARDGLQIISNALHSINNATGSSTNIPAETISVISEKLQQLIVEPSNF